MKKKIAIVGAGLFGCTIALILSKKHEIDLYETKSDILNEASMCNQFRFHLGFHYPRSTKTVNEIQKSILGLVSVGILFFVIGYSYSKGKEKA